MSERAREAVRESVLNHAEHVDRRLPRSFACIPSLGRDRVEMGEIERVMNAACKRSDDFERTSIELMLAERGGDPADLPWFKK